MMFVAVTMDIVFFLAALERVKESVYVVSKEHRKNLLIFFFFY